MHKLLELLFPEERPDTDFVPFSENTSHLVLPCSYKVLYTYTEILKKYLHDIKFTHNKKLIAVISNKIIADHHPNSPIDMLIPVPTHPLRVKSRGYEHTTELIRKFACFHKISLRTDILYRESNTRPLFNLSAAERHNEVTDSFKVWSTKTKDILDQHILIFDDILTTGNTLKAVHECLLPYRPASISALCLSRPLIRPSSRQQPHPDQQ
jgi:predicted amidophosphoribosyltransferase